MKAYCRNINFLLLNFFMISINVMAQNNDSIYSNENWVIADSFYSMNNYFEAVKYYKRYETLQRDLPDWKEWFKVVNKIRLCRQKQRNFSQIKQELSFYKGILPKSQIEIHGKLDFIAGYNEAFLFNYIDAVQHYKNAYKTLITSSINKEIIRATLGNLGITYSRIGDQKSAIKYCDLAIKFCQENDMENYLCNLYSNRGQFLYYDGQYEAANGQYLRAFEFCESDKTKSNLHISRAELLLDLEDFEGCLKQLDDASRLEKVQSQYHKIVANRYLFESGKFEEGRKMIGETLDLIKENGDTRNLIKELVKYSNYLYDERKYDEAVHIAHKALCLHYTDLDSTNIFARPRFTEAIPYTYIVEALYCKAKYFKHNYQNSGSKTQLDEIFFYFDQLLKYFDDLKSNYYSSSSKYRMGSYSQKIYSDAIAFFVDQYERTGNADLLNKGFNLVQRANSYVLKNAISDRRALQIAGVPSDSIEQYLLLSFAASSFNRKDTITSAVSLMEYDNFREDLIQNYPLYAKHNQSKEISILDIQNSLEEGDLLIKYYYFDHNLVVFSVSKDSSFAKNIPFTSYMDSIIRSNNSILSQSENHELAASTYMTNSKIIYDIILKDFIQENTLDEDRHLIIVPDGPLKNVSFSALAINDSNDWSNPNNFLISTHSISYLYYCSQLMSSNSKSSSKGRYIGFGIEYEDAYLQEIIAAYQSIIREDSTASRAISLSPLKYADDEVLTTSEIVNGIPIINSNVTPKQVVSTINDYGIVHISAHAFIDKEDYLKSFVVLNKEEDSEDQKFQLSYSDILNLDMKSDMVVLSACQTSTGENVVGEGLMSLSRAFVQSGSKSSVGSYWNTPDYATKEIMNLFYHNLKDGDSKSKALQKAQIEFITNDQLSSPTIRTPFFWASWAVYGDDTSLTLNTRWFEYFSYSHILLLSILFLLIAVIIKLARSHVKNTKGFDFEQ